MNVYEAREKIALYDPLLAQAVTDQQALAAASVISDAGTAGISAGVFWGLVLGVIGYVGYKAMTGGGLRDVLEPGTVE